MITANIIGTGRVAQTLFSLIAQNEAFSVLGVLGRTSAQLGDWTQGKGITQAHQLPEAMIHIIAVSDRSINLVAGQLSHLSGLIVHTSGTTPMDKLLPNQRIGVLYPLQTFSLQSPPSAEEIPWIIEAKHAQDINLLATFAQCLGSRAHQLSEHERRQLHLAAVMVNNFTHHLWSMSRDWLETQSGDFNLLMPLAKKTTEIALNDPEGTYQTGPARRNDQNTVEQHLAMLGTHPLAQVYKNLTESIVRRHEKEL
ncbi:MAG: hypothetical protein RLZZ593_75 [Bacteroidota bacterium]|jgi:predicted short-subunit dehydrogenase-like oxidoreductase (DUF2520 family)